MACGSAGFKVPSWLEATPPPPSFSSQYTQAVLEDLICKDVKKLNTIGAFLKVPDKHTVETGSFVAKAVAEKPTEKPLLQRLSRGS